MAYRSPTDAELKAVGWKEVDIGLFVHPDHRGWTVDTNCEVVSLWHDDDVPASVRNGEDWEDEPWQYEVMRNRIGQEEQLLKLFGLPAVKI
jgi:hypothetical protein